MVANMMIPKRDVSFKKKQQNKAERHVRTWVVLIVGIACLSAWQEWRVLQAMTNTARRSSRLAEQQQQHEIIIAGLGSSSAAVAKQRSSRHEKEKKRNEGVTTTAATDDETILKEKETRGGVEALSVVKKSDNNDAAAAAADYIEDVFWVPGEDSPRAYRFPKLSTIRTPSTTTTTPRMMVGVLSAASVAEPRQWIRSTWAHGRSGQVWFVVGGPWTSALAQEFAQHSDLLWLDVPESYRGITMKVLGMFTALHQQIQISADDYDYLIKTDDDSYLRLNALEQSARQVTFSQKNQRHNKLRGANALADYLYWGRPCRAGDPVNRKPAHKWYVSPTVFNETTFPKYAQGGGYVLSKSLMNCIVQANQMASKHNNNNNNNNKRDDDDAATTAILPPPMKGVVPIEDAMTGILVDRCAGTCLKDKRFYLDKDADGTRDRLLFVQHRLKTAQAMLQHHIQTCCSLEEKDEEQQLLLFDPVSCQGFVCPTTTTTTSQEQKAR